MRRHGALRLPPSGRRGCSAAAAAASRGRGREIGGGGGVEGARRKTARGSSGRGKRTLRRGTWRRMARREIRYKRVGREQQRSGCRGSLEKPRLDRWARAAALLVLVLKAAPASRAGVHVAQARPNPAAVRPRLYQPPLQSVCSILLEPSKRKFTSPSNRANTIFPLFFSLLG